MTLLDRFIKQPAEIKKYQIDYSEWLADGETVDSVVTAVTVLNPAADDVGEPTMSIGTNQIVGGTVYEYYVSSGTDGKRYKVTFQASTSDSQTVESEIEFKVKDT
jgi:methionine-rich copper-binding protein CopC